MIKTIIISAVLIMATTACVPESYESYKPYKSLTPEDYDKFRKTKAAVYKKLREAKTEEDKTRAWKEICKHEVFVLLESNKRRYKQYRYSGRVDYKEIAEKEIKDLGRAEFMKKYINTHSVGGRNLARIRGNLDEYEEEQRAIKTCYINAYEELTGEKI